MSRIKKLLGNSWFHPRYISIKYMRSMLKLASKYSQGILLDIGCGLRPYEALFTDYVTAYIGLDWPISPEKAHLDVIGDATCLPFCDKAVDTVLASELMEHLPEPKLFLSEVARILKVGGYLILSVPFMEPLHEEPRDFYRFTSHGLRYLLKREGFYVKHIWKRGRWWSVVIGSFSSQALYTLVNPLDREGKRKYRVVGTVIILPLCAILQFTGYILDQIAIKSSKYTLVYLVVAVRQDNK